MTIITERSKITGKGQVQIPKKIREAANINIGDEAAFSINSSGKVEIEFIKKRRLSELAGSLPPRRKYPGLEKEEAKTRQLVAEKEAKDYE